MSNSKKMQEGASSSLFHYTDVSAIKSMLENKRIRLTDYRFLNDSKEFHDGVEYIGNELEKINASSADDVPHLLIQAREWMKIFFQSDTFEGNSPNNMYVCSFSGSADQLSQWRSYGGYCIEFDREKINSALKVDSCCYSEVSKIEHSKSAVGKCVDNTRLSMGSCEGEEMSEAILKHYIELLREVLMFKDYAFREENELRCVIVDDDGGLDVKYRVKGELLAPYIEVAFKLDHVKAIHVGPMQNQILAAESMRSFVRGIEYSNGCLGFDEDSIKIVTSKAPYRNL